MEWLIAHNNLGNVYKSKGDTENAKACYLEAIRIKQDFAVAWSNLGALYSDLGQTQSAISYYNEALRHDSSLAETYNQLGNAHKSQREVDKAIKCYQSALDVNPQFAAVHNNLGTCYFDKNDIKLAIKSYKLALLYDNKYSDAYNNMGNALRIENQLDESIDSYRKCLELQPDSFHAYNNMGNALKEKGFIKEAIHCYVTSIRLSPTFAAAHSNLASLFFEQNRIDEALAHFQEAIKINPLFSDAYSNLGNTYKVLGKEKEALECYESAVKIKPDYAEAYSNMASVYKDKGDYETAVKFYKQALQLKPDLMDAMSNLHHTLHFICDWTDWDQRNTNLKLMLKTQLDITPPIVPSIQPLHSILYDLELSELHEISKRYAHKARTNVILNEKKYIHKPHEKFGKLKIGYVSSDFNDHPLAHLMLSVFSLHNQRSFEIFCYALTPSDDSPYRHRIANSIEIGHFKDISSLHNDEAAELISKDGINILINLNGYTKGNRNEVFALKPSPIQMQYMGFCGTMGADYIDYIIADNVVIPPLSVTAINIDDSASFIPIDYYSHYTEKIIAMPHTYFVNDYKQTMATITPNSPDMPTRKDLGLPEDVFIFCNFNQLHKIDPVIFTSWINILNKVPNSILWLLRFPAIGEENIRKFATQHGLSDDRLVFSDLTDRENHLKRCTLANLFLDTPAYNAHTTACDILWAGTPLITVCNNQQQQKMTSRVSASILTACFLQELICDNITDYENLAVTLGKEMIKINTYIIHHYYLLRISIHDSLFIIFR